MNGNTDQDYSKYWACCNSNDDEKANSGNDWANMKDKEIFRILPIEYFLNDLRCGHLTLPCVTTWADPYECALLKQDYWDEQDSEWGTFRKILSKIHALSWTKKARECDGLWQVYSDCRRKDVVRISAQVGKLLDAIHTRIQNKSSQGYSCQLAMGTVKYEEKENIAKSLSEGFYPPDFQNAKGFAEKILLRKRKEFEYEDEVRIVYLDDAKCECERKFVGIPIANLNEIFYRVQFSPWMCACKKEKYRNELKAEGYPEEQIVESDLYESVRISVPLKSTQ